MKKWMKRFNNERGLTLVELLAVIVILAIVATIAFVMIGNVIENSRKDAHVSNALQVIAAAKLYEASGNQIPTNGVTVGNLSDAGMIETLYDPWEKEAYGASATVKKNGDKYEISSFNASNGKCNLSATEENLLKDGREACNKTY